MSDQIENLKPEDVSIGDRPLSIPSELPILPLRDTVLFPNSFMPLAVARESSVRLIDDAIAETMARAVGVDVTVRHEGHVEEYIEFTSADDTMRTRFGFTPTIAFEDGISRLHRHIADCGLRIADYGSPRS